MTLPHRNPRGLRRVVRVVAAVLIVVAALLVAAVEIVPPWLLRSGRLLAAIDGDPQSLQVTWAEARAPSPGRVVARALEIRGSDPNVEWWFHMDTADIRFSLLELASRRFHATSVRATGLVFRIRQRLLAGERTPAAEAPLPPIPGFGRVPVKGGPPVFPPPEPPSQYWSVRIDDLVADPTEQIWVDQFRYDGKARVTGGFVLWPQKNADVGPATVELLGGRLSLGRDVIASPFHGRLDGRIASFDPRTVRGEQVYRWMSARAQFSGEMPDVRFFNFYLRSSPEPRLSGGHGKIGGDVRLARGKGTLRLSLAAEGVRARYEKVTLAGDAVVRLRLDPWTPFDSVGAVSRSSAELAGISEAGAPKERDWWGKFALGPGTLSSRGVGLTLATRVNLTARDARPLYTLFGVGLPKWAQGIARLDGVAGSAAVTLASSVVEARNVEARGDDFAIEGDYRKAGKTSKGAFLISRGKLAVGVDVTSAKPSIRIAHARRWFAETRAPVPPR